MRRAVLSSIAAAALLLALANTATAASGVEITLHNSFNTTGEETFTATGGFCAAGSAETSDLRIVGGRAGLSFHLVKTLTCDDGSGTLVINVDVATARGHAADARGGWSIAGGTDRWAGARGGGEIFADYVPEGSIDHYTGVITR